MKPVIAFLLCLLTILPTAFADTPPSLNNIPDSLKEWVPWVKDEILNIDCIRINSDAKSSECLWFGESELVIEKDKASLSLNVHILENNTSLPLPTGFGLHLSNIEISKEGKSFGGFSLSQNTGLYSVTLPKGSYQIQGKIHWDKLPNQIPLPESYGPLKIRMSLGQENLEAVREANSIALTSKEGIEVSDGMNVEVYRMLTDGSPLIMQTRLQLSVSGKSRIEEFGSFLPANSQLISLDGPLQSYLDPKGNVKIKVSQGTFTINFVSALGQPLNKIEFKEKPSEVWPKEEIWVWEGSSELRSVELKNVDSINTAQAHLPPDWQSDSAIVVSSLSTVELDQKRRGEEKPGANELTLSRSIWPSLKGEGFSVHDTITSSFKGTFRLNALETLNVGRVSIDSNPIPITIDPDNKLKGIEIRKQSQTIDATSQIADSKEMSASGWDQDFENINVQVNIPPSWKLFYVKGASEAWGTWISTWSIFDVFILVILIIFTQQIMGTKLAVLYAAITILGRTEFMLPTVFFSYIVILIALLKLTSEKSSKYILVPMYFCISLSALAFLIQGITFAKLQVIQLLYPQLQSGTRYQTILQSTLAVVDSMPLAWVFILIGIAITVFILKWGFSGKDISGKIFRLFIGVIVISITYTVLGGIASIFFLSRSYTSPTGYGGSYNSIPGVSMPQEAKIRPKRGTTANYEDSLGGSGDPSLEASLDSMAIPEPMMRQQSQKLKLRSRNIQAGPSLPSWTWRQAGLSIAGPISADHKIELVFIKPGLQRLFSLARIFIIFGLICLLSKFLLSIFRERSEQIRSIIPQGNTVASALFILMFLFPSESRADYPNTQILEGLKNRITSTQCNETNCSTIDSIEIFLREHNFEIKVSAFSKGKSSISIPGNIEDLRADDVLVNNSPSPLVRVSEQFLQVKVEEGISQIMIRGSLSEKNAISVKIPQAPLRISVLGTGWDIGAYNKDGTSDTIQVSRLSGESIDNTVKIDSPKHNSQNWFQVSRTLTIGDQIRSVGSITRLGSLDSPANVSIPLKPGEQLTVAEIATKDKNMLATFQAGQSNLNFESSFENTDKITLTADKIEAISEVWNVSCADYVRCTFEGDLAPNKRLNISGENEFKFIPFPEEKITIQKNILNSADGESINIQNILHTVSWGETVLTGTLELSLITTKQSSLDITFADPTISIESVIVDEVSDSRPFVNGQVKLLLESESKSVRLKYRKTGFSPGTKEITPSVKLSTKAGNITTIVNTEQPRWLLWLDGSSWGPAVLIWGKIIANLIILFILRRLSLLTISTSSLLLLASALSLMPTIILPIPVLWISLVRESRLKNLANKLLPKYAYLTILSVLAVLSVAIVYVIIRLGLLGDPPLLVAGNNSSLTYLKWYSDFCGSAGAECDLPTPWLISLPIGYWRALTLLISLFLFIFTVKLVKETAHTVRGGE